MLDKILKSSSFLNRSCFNFQGNVCDIFHDRPASIIEPVVRNKKMFVPRAVNRKPPPKKPVKRPAAIIVTDKNTDCDEDQKKQKLANKSKDDDQLQLSGTNVKQEESISKQQLTGETSQKLGTSVDSSNFKLDSSTQNSGTPDESKDDSSPIGNIDKARTTNESEQKDELQLKTNIAGIGNSQLEASNQEKNEEEEEDEAPIVSFSKNQRWPEADEPVCVVCGRYGEYICSRTDVDVCSLECKARNLARSIKKNTASKLMELTGTCIPDGSTSSIGTDQETQEELPNEDEASPDIAAPLVGYTYHEHEDISDINMEQVQEIRAQVEIFVEGVDIPRPIVEFSHLGMPKTMENNLENAGYMNPTPVQMQVIPTALRDRDTMVCAQTSSGKTASFLIPTILHMYNSVCQNTDCRDPLAVILTPTRELAMQIEDQAKQLMKGLPNMKTALLVGGMPLPPQLHRLSQGIQLIIATPGRLLEIIQKNGVSLQAVKTLIIDEFDTMLHMGFQQQVMDIVVHLPEPHQTLLFSATIPKSREQVASSLLGNPVYISIGTPSTPCASVKQIVMWVEEPSKKKKLFAILQDPKHYRPPIVVFVDSKLGADLLAETIEKVCEISAVSLHGDKRQTERTAILQGFLSGEHPVIVCTGVLGRGIDLPGVTMVINFDMPSSVEEYIHQIGRTGRLGSRGTAVTFINNGAKHLFLEFVNTLKPLGVQLPLQLVNSQHLHNQKQKHKSKKEQQVKSRKGHNTGYFARKQKQSNWDVGDLLAKRKRKTKL